MKMNKFWEYTVTGVVAGLILGWLLSLMSGSIFVVIGVGCVGAIVGVVLGIIHRNDTNAKWF